MVSAGKRPGVVKTASMWVSNPTPAFVLFKIMNKLTTFDNTMLSLFRLCPRKFKYRMIDDLTPLALKDYKLVFGGALHEALAVWYKSGSIQEATDKFLVDWMLHEGQDKTDQRCAARGITILSQYIEKYQHEPFVVNPEYIEVGFSAELDEYIICGKMDGIVKWTLGFDGFCVLEHKFSTSKGYLVTEPNQQLDTYIWGAMQLLNAPVIGAYFNLCYHNKKGIENNEFIRELTRRTPEKIKRWEEETIDWIKSVNICLERGRFPKNSSNCGAFYRECEYTRLCKTEDESEREAIRACMYKIDKWNPYPEAREVRSHEN